MFQIPISFNKKIKSPFSSHNYNIYSEKDALSLIEKGLSEIHLIKDVLSKNGKDCNLLIYSIYLMEKYYELNTTTTPLFFNININDNSLKKMIFWENIDFSQHNKIQNAYKDAIESNNFYNKNGSISEHTQTGFQLLFSTEYNNVFYRPIQLDFIHDITEAIKLMSPKTKLEFNFIALMLYQAMGRELPVKKERIKIYTDTLVESKEMQYISEHFLEEVFSFIDNFNNFDFIRFTEHENKTQHLNYLDFICSNIVSSISAYEAYFISHYVYFSLKDVKKHYSDFITYKPATEKESIPLFITNHREAYKILSRLQNFYLFYKSSIKPIFHVELRYEQNQKSDQQTYAIDIFKRMDEFKNLCAKHFESDEYTPILNLLERQELQENIDTPHITKENSRL